ncbi:Cysteine-rich motor neuron 1 protein [Blomia tropicalis]|nr:Cysteine-rich motor neuron 1 protein [Blomia tropicalis]
MTLFNQSGPLLSIAKLNQSLASESSELSVCSRVQCDSDCFNSKSKPIQCPTDSYILEYESEDQRCCIQTCKCLSNKCNNCTFGYNIIHRGNLQQPGNCCDRIQCVDGPNSLPKSIKPPFYCIHNDKQYKHGEKWHSTDCNQCQCRDGVAVCNKINNCSLIHGCYSNSEEKKQLNDDECCSECKASQLFMYIIISSITVLVVVSIGIIYFILCLHTPGDTPVPKDTVKYNTVQTDENHDIYLTNNQSSTDSLRSSIYLDQEYLCQCINSIKFERVTFIKDKDKDTK